MTPSCQIWTARSLGSLAAVEDLSQEMQQYFQAVAHAWRNHKRTALGTGSSGVSSHDL